MFKCDDCNAEFEEPETVPRYHPYQESCAVEYWAVCPYCHGTNFEMIVRLECER